MVGPYGFSVTRSNLTRQGANHILHVELARTPRLPGRVNSPLPMGRPRADLNRRIRSVLARSSGMREEHVRVSLPGEIRMPIALSQLAVKALSAAAAQRASRRTA